MDYYFCEYRGDEIIIIRVNNTTVWATIINGRTVTLSMEKDLMNDENILKIMRFKAEEISEKEYNNLIKIASDISYSEQLYQHQLSQLKNGNWRKV